MTFFSLALITGVLGILGTEWGLWRLFRMRMDGLHFPGENGPVSTITGLGRARIFAFLHAVLLALCLVLSFTFLW